MMLAVAAMRPGLLCVCGWLWNLILSLLLCAVHGIDYYSERKPYLRLIHISCCMGVLICECMSLFNNVLHFLRVIYFISNPKQLKWLSFCSLTHPPQCPLQSYSARVSYTLCFFCLCADKSVCGFGRRKVNAGLNAQGLTSWQKEGYWEELKSRCLNPDPIYTYIYIYLFIYLFFWF